ncbi:hypothetical protein GCM10027168_09900 [Streptomyces capparidis]
MLVGDFLGMRGRVDFGHPERVSFAQAALGERAERAAGNHAVQSLAAGAARGAARTAPGEYLLLSGPVDRPAREGWERRIAAAVRQERYGELARVPGELCGCLVSASRVVLFRNLASTEGLLYRADGAVVRWSTDPVDLVDADREEFGREAIWRCCRGDEVFIYRQLAAVRPGEVVVADRAGVRRERFEAVAPLDLPRRTPLAGYAEAAWELLLREAGHYRGAGRVGVMVSGGLDSAAVLCALVEAGADVVAYHHVLDDPLADESPYARAVCDGLGVPLRLLPAGYGAGFPPSGRAFPHPFLNVGFPWLEGIAERVAGDGVRLLVWGRDGDLRFGPLRFGLNDVLTGDVPVREKAALCAGLVSSPWGSRWILRSALPRRSLFDEAGADGGGWATDFLRPLPGVPEDPGEGVPAAEEYSVKDACADLVSWRPRGVLMCNPLGARGIQRLAARLPAAYRLLPYQGQLISKPVLRLLLSRRLPEAVWRRHGRLWMNSAHRHRALAGTADFRDLLGSAQSRLVRMGVVDPGRLGEVLADPHRRRRNAETLVHAAMTEIFLRHYPGRTP